MEFIGLIVLILVFFMFIINSYEDIKKREIYDYFNYSLSFFILFVGVFHSILISSFSPIKFVSFGILIGFLFGSILYYLGIWGGGDAKFLIGFSGASYYIIDFIDYSSNLSIVIKNIFSIFSIYIEIFFNFFKNYLLYIDLLFLFILFLTFFLKNKSEKKSIYTLFSILFLLFLGLYLNIETYLLLIFGFLSFILIFFADEEVFNCIYFKIKKRYENLLEGDRIDIPIKIDKIVVVSLEEGKLGLTKENISNIDECTVKFKKKFSNKLINIRKILPYSSLVILNFIFYILKVLSLDEKNLDILIFLFKFLLISFMVGGVLSIFIILYYFAKYFKKIKFKFKIYEKELFFISFLVILILSFLNPKFIISFSFLFIYILFRITKLVEKLIFVEKKSIHKLTLGDWIVQDIKVEGKLIYAIEDFKLGVNEIQLEKLKKLSNEYPHLKSLYVKDGIPFLPPLFVGFIIVLFI